MMFTSYSLSCIFLFMSASTALAQNPTPLATAKQQALGTKVVKVAGRITAGAAIFRNTAYLQDETAGIAVFNNAFRNGVRVGDSVIIENGTLAEFGQSTGQAGTGLTQLSGDSLRFTVVPTERRETAPRTVAIPRVSGPSGEEYEGQLIRLRNVSFVTSGQNTLFQGETTYQVVDGFGNDIDVRIDGGTEIAINNLAIPSGTIDLVGLVSQFRSSYQILPRFATDIGQLPIEKDTVPRAKTLDVTTWNIKWFGSTDSAAGPRDKNRQIRSVRQVMDSVQADLYGFQEVVTEEVLSRLTDSIKGTYASVYASEIPSPQKLAWVYNSAVITPVSSGLAVVGTSGDSWASGRFPFRLTFDANINGAKVRYVAFVIHAKATDSLTAQRDYDRRKQDGIAFHSYLTQFYADSNVIIIGDFNDDVTTSVINPLLPTPWLSFVEDTANFNVLTKPLSERGLASYVGFTRSFLDHIIVSNEVSRMVHRTYIEAPTAYLSSYTTTVTDHLPVTVRLFLDSTSTSVYQDEASNFSIRISPHPLSSTGMVEMHIAQPSRLLVEIVNISGNTVMTCADEFALPSTRVIPFDVSTLSNGVYALRVFSNGSVRSMPFVVAR